MYIKKKIVLVTFDWMKQIVVVYPSPNGRFYVQDPVSKKTKWLTLPMYKKLKRFCRFEVYKQKANINSKTLSIKKRLVLRAYYISYNTADRNMRVYPTPTTFAVPLYQRNACMVSNQQTVYSSYRDSLPSHSQIMGVRLHKAVIPKSRQVVHRHNCYVVLQRDDTGARYNVALGMGHYSANDLGRVLQSNIRAAGFLDFTATLNLVTGRFRISSTSTPFRILRSGTTGNRLFGFLFEGGGIRYMLFC